MFVDCILKLGHRVLNLVERMILPNWFVFVFVSRIFSRRMLQTLSLFGTFEHCFIMSRFLSLFFNFPVFDMYIYFNYFLSYLYFILILSILSFSLNRECFIFIRFCFFWKCRCFVPDIYV